MGRVHRRDHVRREFPNAIVDLLDPSPFRSQDRVAVLQDWQDHFASRVKAGSFFAVLDSGKLIWTSGWSFLNVVETTKKISRMIRISTSETIIMRGARRFRTAKFMD